MYYVYMYTHMHTLTYLSIYLSLSLYIYIYIYRYIYMHMRRTARPGGVGHLSRSEVGGVRLETSSRCVGLPNIYHRPRFIGIRVKRRGVPFHRIRDFRQHCFSSIYIYIYTCVQPETQSGRPRLSRLPGAKPVA